MSFKQLEFLFLRLPVEILMGNPESVQRVCQAIQDSTDTQNQNQNCIQNCLDFLAPGISYIRDDRFDEALPLLEISAAHAYDCPRWWCPSQQSFSLIGSLKMQKSPSEAIRFFDNCIAKDPDEIMYHSDKIEALFNLFAGAKDETPAPQHLLDAIKTFSELERLLEPITDDVVYPHRSIREFSNFQDEFDDKMQKLDEQVLIERIFNNRDDAENEFLWTDPLQLPDSFLLSKQNLFSEAAFYVTCIAVLAEESSDELREEALDMVAEHLLHFQTENEVYSEMFCALAVIFASYYLEAADAEDEDRKEHLNSGESWLAKVDENRLDNEEKRTLSDLRRQYLKRLRTVKKKGESKWQ